MEDAEIPESVKSFGEEICEPDSLISIILRAHLKIEAEADRLISLMCAKPDRYETIRLSAAQKFRLCEALWGDPGGDSEFWKSLERLNTLRNEIAHGLRQPALETKLRTFIATIAEDEKGNSGRALEDSLVLCLCYLFHDMAVLERYCSRT